MKIAIKNLPNDPKALKELIVEMSNEINALKEQIALFKLSLFGRKSEKCEQEKDHVQLSFDFGNDESNDESNDSLSNVTVENKEEAAIEVASHKRSKRGRKPLSDLLPREKRTIDIPQEDKICECGCEKHVIGSETSEHLEFIPAKCIVIENIRLKYACKKCEGTESNKPTVMIASPPEQVIPKSFATPSLLSYIITSKYVDSLPFYRLSKMFARHGAQISRATMCNWVIRIAVLLKPLIELFVEEIIKSSYVCADETPIQVLKEKGRSASQKSYMWVFATGANNDPTILYNYSQTRAGSVPREFFENYEGYIQTDGYKAYNFISNNQGQKHLACMAHCRRGFFQSIIAVGKNAKPGIAHKAFDMINSLYKIEAKARQEALSYEQIKERRQNEAKPILNKLKLNLKKWSNTVVPKSNTGKAISYALDNWDKLVTYIEDGRLKIDNSFVERCIRPFAIGRRNWLFADSAQGATATATLFSVIETAKANGLEPFWYMYTLLEKLPQLKTKQDFIPWMPQNIDKTIVDNIRKKHQKTDA